MAGAGFVRADLHVHSFPDDGGPGGTPEQYLEAAAAADIKVLALTDHNTVRNVDTFLAAASSFDIYLVPGIEITTHQGHLLALFAPDRLDELRHLASPKQLKLESDPNRPKS
jgi:predicted metal-dependent phosphoesterase TrpH